MQRNARTAKEGLAMKRAWVLIGLMLLAGAAFANAGDGRISGDLTGVLPHQQSRGRGGTTRAPSCAARTAANRGSSRMRAR